RLLDWSATTSLADGLGQTLGWMANERRSIGWSSPPEARRRNFRAAKILASSVAASSSSDLLTSQSPCEKGSVGEPSPYRNGTTPRPERR
ncbi:MAG: hypothetical protein ACXVDD_07695, partial [Polyangia bacterium]